MLLQHTIENADTCSRLPLITDTAVQQAMTALTWP